MKYLKGRIKCGIVNIEAYIFHYFLCKLGIHRMYRSTWMKHGPVEKRCRFCDRTVKVYSLEDLLLLGAVQ